MGKLGQFKICGRKYYKQLYDCQLPIHEDFSILLNIHPPTYTIFPFGEKINRGYILWHLMGFVRLFDDIINNTCNFRSVFWGRDYKRDSVITWSVVKKFDYILFKIVKSTANIKRISTINNN